jgi:adenosylcobinamide kinase/adenosylcobinamide-phosphate guanylyltransferase
MIHFYLGGARSGKSSHAEQQACEFEQQGLAVVYIATGQGLDDAMQERINHHQASRPQHWQTVEEPLQLAEILKNYARQDRCLLVDCLTLWLSNQLHEHNDEQFLQAKKALLATLAQLPGEIILVSNEVGQGIVPLGELSRNFVDQAGWLHQEIAQIADKVRFVIAGIAQPLKG